MDCKYGKTQDINGKPAELLKYGGETIMNWMQVSCSCWQCWHLRSKHSQLCTQRLSLRRLTFFITVLCWCGLNRENQSINIVYVGMVETVSVVTMHYIFLGGGDYSWVFDICECICFLTPLHNGRMLASGNSEAQCASLLASTTAYILSSKIIVFLSLHLTDNLIAPSQLQEHFFHILSTYINTFNSLLFKLVFHLLHLFILQNIEYISNAYPLYCSKMKSLIKYFLAQTQKYENLYCRCLSGVPGQDL